MRPRVREGRRGQAHRSAPGLEGWRRSERTVRVPGGQGFGNERSDFIEMLDKGEGADDGHPHGIIIGIGTVAPVSGQVRVAERGLRDGEYRFVIRVLRVEELGVTVQIAQGQVQLGVIDLGELAEMGEDLFEVLGQVTYILATQDGPCVLIKHDGPELVRAPYDLTKEVFVIVRLLSL